MSPVEDKQGPLVGGPEVGDIYSVGTDFCLRMPALRRLDEEVDELMGSSVPTNWGTSACVSEKKSVREAATAAALPVKQVTAEVRRVTLKRSSVSLENRGSKKRKSREHECKLCSAGTFISTPVRRQAVRHHLPWIVVPDTACWTCKRQYVSSGQLKEACGRKDDQIRLRSTCGPVTAPDVCAGTCGGVVRTRILIPSRLPFAVWSATCWTGSCYVLPINLKSSYTC